MGNAPDEKCDYDDGGWHEIVELFEQGGEPLSIGDHKVFVKGPIGDVTIVHVDLDPNHPHSQRELMAVSKALEASGIERALIMPSTVRFVRLRRVSLEDAVFLIEKADGKTVVTTH